MNQDLQDKVCIVTGGNSGIGLMTAVGLAKAGYHVFIGCRSVIKAEKAVDYIHRNSGNKNVEFLPLNLASLNSVHQFVDLFLTRKLPITIDIQQVISLMLTLLGSLQLNNHFDKTELIKTQRTAIPVQGWGTKAKMDPLGPHPESSLP